MLVEFSVGNFRSFKDKEVLSLYPSLKASRTHDTKSYSTPKVMRIGALFGANGSGKSNFVTAVGVLVHLVENSAAYNSNVKLSLESYKFSGKSDSKTEFEVVFLSSDVLWEYSVSVIKSRIYNERLRKKIAAKGSKFKTVFNRVNGKLTKLDDDLNAYGEMLSKQTNPNQLFLSKLDQSGDKVTRPAFRWITRKLRVVANVDDLSQSVSASHCEDASERKIVRQFLNALDIQVEAISITESEYDIPDELKGVIQSSGGQVSDSKIKHLDVGFGHRNELGDIIFLDIEDESAGTQNLFKLVGPLLETLDYGYTLFVDELHQTFHTALLDVIVNLFLDEEVNKSGAQLIFTTHDVSVMRKLERDEIWFVEKDAAGSSELIGLSEFTDEYGLKNRKNAAFGKRYLDGRYNALPYPDMVNMARLVDEYRNLRSNSK